MQVYLVNPSDVSFGVGVITPRWLYVLAGAPPRSFGDPIVVDETIETFRADRIHPGDIVGIGIHTSNAYRGFGIHVLGSFIFGLPTDTPESFSVTCDIADRSGMTFAQFVPLTPFPGTVDFEKWEKDVTGARRATDRTPVTRHWLVPTEQRPKVYIPHPKMSPEEIRSRTQQVWDSFYSLAKIWRRSRCVPTLRSRLAFLLISKLYCHMYAKTGIATDSARQSVAVKWARIIGRPCQRLFAAKPMPELRAVPVGPIGKGLPRVQPAIKANLISN
jgi:hypothetical protein